MVGERTTEEGEEVTWMSGENVSTTKNEQSFVGFP